MAKDINSRNRDSRETKEGGEMSKYSAAKELFEEFMVDSRGFTHFDDWCDEQGKPKDELFDNFETFMGWLSPKPKNEGGVPFKVFKKLFKDQLNGTKGLDELETILERRISERPDNFETLKEALLVSQKIKARLESE